jgi:hypothetical protein
MMHYYVRFEVLTAATVKIIVFWYLMLCTQVDRYQCSSEMLLMIYQTTWCHNLDDSNL